MVLAVTPHQAGHSTTMPRGICRSFTSVRSSSSLRKCTHSAVDKTLKVPVTSGITLLSQCQLPFFSFTLRNHSPLWVTYCKNHYTRRPDPDPARQQIFQMGLCFCKFWGWCGETKKKMLLGSPAAPTQLPARVASPGEYVRRHGAAKLKTNRTNPQATRLR